MFKCEIAEFARAVATSARGRTERARMRCNGSQSVHATCGRRVSLSVRLWPAAVAAPARHLQRLACSLHIASARAHAGPLARLLQ